LYREKCKAINTGYHIVGRAFFTTVYKDSNYQIHKDIENIPENTILYVLNPTNVKRAVFGSLVSKYLLLYKKVTGIVIEGTIRDGNTLIKENYPIWCEGLSPLGCYNKNVCTDDMPQINTSNTIIIADDCGVAVIPDKFITNKTLERLKFIEKQEDTWFACIDNGQNTFKTVCEKDYSILQNKTIHLNK